MTQFLPSSLLALFEARPPLPYVPPVERGPPQPLTGIAAFVSHLPPEEMAAEPTKFMSRKQRKQVEAATKAADRIAAQLPQWDPFKDPNVTENPYKTLVVARLVMQKHFWRASLPLLTVS
jgi:U1 small nuclear ribonucleoprotein